jgi:hypothetical protein
MWGLTFYVFDGVRLADFQDGGVDNQNKKGSESFPIIYYI